MNKLFWPLVFLLILIHTLDMELTREYVGNNWQNETFLPMSLCIKYFNIYNALWISRVIVYISLFLCYCFKENKFVISVFLFVTILYYTSMVNWFFSLNILTWPKI
jgi:hypothetical protein